MSSEDFFDGDDEYDDAFLEELDAIEAHSTQPPAPKPSTSRAKSLATEDSFDDITFDFNEEELEEAERAVAKRNNSRPIASSSKTRQTTLFGDILQAPSFPKKHKEPSRTASAQAPKTKHWDHTAFAKTGTRKGKGKESFRNDDDEDEEELEFEQFPAPFISRMWSICFEY